MPANKTRPASKPEVMDAATDIMEAALEGLCDLNLDDGEILGVLISQMAYTAVMAKLSRAELIRAALKTYDFHKQAHDLLSVVRNATETTSSENNSTHKRN